MRYRFFTGERRGQHQNVLVYERQGVFRFQMLRIEAVKLTASKLEDVTPNMVDIVGACVVSPIGTAPDDTHPYDLLEHKVLNEHPVR